MVLMDLILKFLKLQTKIIDQKENNIELNIIIPLKVLDIIAHLAEKMNAALAGNCEAMGAAALEKVRPYTIENMARVQQEIFERG